MGGSLNIHDALRKDKCVTISHRMATTAMCTKNAQLPDLLQDIGLLCASLPNSCLHVQNNPVGAGGDCVHAQLMQRFASPKANLASFSMDHDTKLIIK